MASKLCRRLIVFLWVVIAVQEVGAESFLPGLKPLTLEDAIETALLQHPNLRSVKGVRQAEEARLGEARSGYYPRLDLSADYRRATANFAPSSRTGSSINLIGGSRTSNSSFNNYVAGLSLQQQIFDFGKTRAQVDSAIARLRASEWDESAARQEVIFDVKVAYFDLLETRRLVQVNDETVRQFEEHLEQAEGFFKVGTRPRFDVTKAEVDLTNARLDLIKAKNAAELARITLATAMGTPGRPIGEMEDLLAFERFAVTEEEAIQEAQAGRPEWHALLAKQRSFEASVRSARRTHFPVLSGSADYSYQGQRFPLVWNWGVGLSLTFPIFSGYQTQSQIAEAKANLSQVEADAEVFRQSILLEVQQAYLSLIEADERVQTSGLVVRQAEENLALANGRFQAGVGTSVERTDAQVLLSNAKTSRIQALYDYRVAVARLERAMGRE